MRQEAKSKLHQLRKICKVGDVITPIGDLWEAMKNYQISLQ